MYVFNINTIVFFFNGTLYMVCIWYMYTDKRIYASYIVSIQYHISTTRTIKTIFEMVFHVTFLQYHSTIIFLCMHKIFIKKVIYYASSFSSSSASRVIKEYKSCASAPLPVLLFVLLALLLLIEKDKEFA